MTGVDYQAARRGVAHVLDEAIADARQLRAELERIGRDMDVVLDRVRRIRKAIPAPAPNPVPERRAGLLRKRAA